jgi:ribosomal protein S19E (S16A)
MKKISTTALSKILSIPTKELFTELSNLGYITKKDNNWVLTEAGKEKGGEYKESKQYGTYIVWSEDLDIGIKSSNHVVTSTTIGKHFNLSANKINYILSELGWLNKGLKGWVVTEQGKKLGGIQDEIKKTGVPFVRWSENIINSKSLIETVNQMKGTTKEKKISNEKKSEDVDFREKFQAKHRSTDGHFVRSKAEMLIDNWLYMAEIVHAYERKLPIEEDVYSDFYIPTGKVYIEYWGYENESKYLARKKRKIELYKKYGFNLIELVDEDVQNLDDILPRLLLKFGVQAY